MKIFVTGHKGMLGHVVCRYFREKRAEVMTTDRRFEIASPMAYLDLVAGSGCDFVINALGKIWQKEDDIDRLYEANALFPQLLAEVTKNRMPLIHPSTDCVFNGTGGNYNKEDAPDCVDSYGRSKMLGEMIHFFSHVTVFRTSIIGPELNGRSGLMQWLLNQDKSVNGFTNHYWNGITTLEWAKLAYERICGNLATKHRLIQVTSGHAISKFELLESIASVWGKKIDINSVVAEKKDKSLRGDVVLRSIKEQLVELRKWYS